MLYEIPSPLYQMSLMEKLKISLYFSVIFGEIRDVFQQKWIMFPFCYFATKAEYIFNVF